MSKEIVLKISDNLENFETWLNFYSKVLSNKKFPIHKGYIQSLGFPRKSGDEKCLKIQ
jgi:hypothetical protein